MKTFADDKMNVTKELTFNLGMDEKTLREREKMLVTKMFPFPTIFSKDFFLSFVMPTLISPLQILPNCTSVNFCHLIKS